MARLRREAASSASASYASSSSASASRSSRRPVPVPLPYDTHVLPQPPPAPRPRNVQLPPQVNAPNGYAINPALAYDVAAQPRGPRIVFDLSRSPTSIREPESRRGCLLETAVYPPLPSLAIISPLLPKAIVVHRSNINSNFVTVADVLGTLCGLLNVRDVYGRRPLDYLHDHIIFRGLGPSRIGDETFELHVSQ